MIPPSTSPDSSSINRSGPILDLKLKATDNEARVFAGGQLLLCLLIAWWLYGGGHGTAAAMVLLISTVFCTVGMVRPPAIAWVYAGWMLITFPVGWVMSYVVASLVYFLVVTPIGLIVRVVGRDALGRTFEPESETYWVETPDRAESARYFRQF